MKRIIQRVLLRSVAPTLVGPRRRVPLQLGAARPLATATTTTSVRVPHHFFSTQPAESSSLDDDDDDDDDDDVYESTNTTDDAFRIFQLPHRFLIDEVALKQSYRQLMAELHPDKQRHHPTTSPHDTTDGSSSSSLSASQVTRAYDRLRHKHTRATHLMEVLGRPMEEATSGALVGCEFLMQVMLLRETIDDALASAAAAAGGDTNTNNTINCHNCNATLREMWEENQIRIDETCQELDRLIQEGQLDKARELTARLQYWNRIDETIRDKMECFD